LEEDKETSFLSWGKEVHLKSCKCGGVNDRIYRKLLVTSIVNFCSWH